MKQKKQKKLVLNKKTIANLSQSEMKELKGGATYGCGSHGAQCTNETNYWCSAVGATCIQTCIPCA